MLVAVAQLDCQIGAIEANTARLREWAHAARDAGCDVLVFPEMMDTGYEMTAIVRNASTWDQGAFPHIRQMAADLDLFVICGLSERTAAGIHNAVAVVDPDGELLFKYRKVHLFTGAPIHEERYLIPGDSMDVVTIGGFRWGIMVCYDIRFPEMARAMALLGADVIAVPAAFPFPRLRHWTTLLAARAIENQLYIVAANRVGTDGAITFCGTSQILDPAGAVAAGAPESGELLISAPIRRESIDAARKSLRVFDDRVPRVYRTIEDK
jgi:predicted amidohydrolase